MKLIFEIDNEDIQRVQDFYSKHEKNSLVKERYNKNIETQNHLLSENKVWNAILMCLLTSQQNSSPNSPIMKFLKSKSKFLDFSECSKMINFKDAFSNELSDIGRIRYINKIPEYAEFNLNWLQSGGWEVFKNIYDTLNTNKCSTHERIAAQKIQGLKGIGPKQSRNLLQELGLTYYEIPIDSRIMNHFNKHIGFPIELKPDMIASEYFYSFIMDKIIELCNQSNIYPCLYDAAVFSSYDN